MPDQPELSIVIAAPESRPTLAECLTEIARQTEHLPFETLVVTNVPDDARFVREKFPQMIVIEAERSSLIPELWGKGASAARGRIIALTTSSCIPAKSWVAEILRAHQEPHTAIGGAIENSPDAGLIDWAIYFVRYTSYMLPFRAGPMQVPGDNGSYKRDAIAGQMEWIGAQGFWEAEVNARLKSQNQTLWGDPRIIVYHKRAFTLGGFSRQRFSHGRIFGRMRAQKSVPSRRIFYILTSPAIPFVFLARILRNMLVKRRHWFRFILSLPLILWFLFCWSLGELAGLISR